MLSPRTLIRGRNPQSPIRRLPLRGKMLCVSWSTSCGGPQTRKNAFGGPGSGPRRETGCRTIKKPSFSRKKRRLLSKRSTGFVRRVWAPSHVRSRSREHNQGTPTRPSCSGPYMRNRLQAGFLTCILPGGSFPFALGEQWTTPRGFPKRVSRRKSEVARTLPTSNFPLFTRLLEQMLTAARPSRILTTFPFRYPKARGLETCSRHMHFTKSVPWESYGAVCPASSEKLALRRGMSRGVLSTPCWARAYGLFGAGRIPGGPVPTTRNRGVDPPTLSR